MITIDAVHTTPCYILDENALRRNMEVLDAVQKRTECKILLALKVFSMFSTFPIIRQFLCGVTASSYNEARLGYEEFGKEVHLYSPAYKESEFKKVLHYCDYIVFNSFPQWNRFKPCVSKKVKCGIRVNPEHSEVAIDRYNPCVRYSRLGVTRTNFQEKDLTGITGLHFHTLCELNSDALARTLAAFERKFGAFLREMEWVNFGGGHHITRKDYDIDRLCDLIHEVKNRYHVDVYLEPGEAVVLNTAVLVASVLDVISNEMEIAILDTSAVTHMPDILEAPYRPEIAGAGKPGEFEHTYRLGGLTCMAGDIIGDYSFPYPLTVGSKVVFLDQAHSTMVKNNTFNGVPLPAIAVQRTDRKIDIVREFGYEDYKERLS